MFKLAVFTDEISHDLERACAICREFGVEGVELRGVWRRLPHEWTRNQVRDIRAMLSDQGLAVCSIASPFGKCDVSDKRDVAKHMDILRASARVARELNCTIVRGFAFWRRTESKPWDEMLRAYAQVPGILEDEDVMLGLENEYQCYVGTAAHARYFLDRLQSPHVKIIWDPTNHVQDPDGAAMRPFPEGYRLIRKDMVHVHVKDAAPGPGGTFPNVFLGTGVVDWGKQLQALKDDGYDGYLSLETHITADQFPESMRSLYGRYLTDDPHEGASKVCLAWLRRTTASLR
ncbi:MAG: sugar phosphate isomerase/epimerase [Candidatus Hydrogenedentes bacterium]|nr:sugar phosphate isomerase/epimerase [Candidatus Hydrogenedentota bacterium]